jgi:hypothetical protein
VAQGLERRAAHSKPSVTGVRLLALGAAVLCLGRPAEVQGAGRGAARVPVHASGSGRAPARDTEVDDEVGTIGTTMVLGPWRFWAADHIAGRAVRVGRLSLVSSLQWLAPATSFSQQPAYVLTSAILAQPSPPAGWFEAHDARLELGVGGIRFGTTGFGTATTGPRSLPRQRLPERPCDNPATCLAGAYARSHGGASLRGVTPGGWIVSAAELGTLIVLVLGSERETGARTTLVTDVYGSGAGVRISQRF